MTETLNTRVSCSISACYSNFLMVYKALLNFKEFFFIKKCIFLDYLFIFQLSTVTINEVSSYSIILN